MNKIIGVLLVALAGLGVAQTAALRVAHLSPDAPAVEIWVGGNKVEAFSKLAFKAVSAYQSLPAGEVELAVVPAGQTGPRIEARVRLEAGRSYTLALIGLQAQLKPTLIADAPVPVESGKARLRLVHAVPNFPGLDIRSKDGALLAQNLGFASASEYRLVDAGGNLEPVLFAAGDTQRGIPVPAYRLEAGKTYTLFLAGQYNHRAENFGLSFVWVEDR
ncbi:MULTISPECIES: DUF4397 domain-containing protein [unclassified Meiothermus]|uniref:DUF4397 domain-containing protein n=1 Tax=unclassified Meiothermus TaxID=370471 RepID=UPI000D7BEAC6|nr:MULTISPECIES: DUF4397 domain-containing protein [unclassified Meiothermus]PZA06352.1 cell wall anchor [Meiothermus sp. Pnk-1]RYM35225.1 DUF4397 domain-containing protein [Meiothermus sp. PNK-Is4]